MGFSAIYLYTLHLYLLSLSEFVVLSELPEAARQDFLHFPLYPTKFMRNLVLFTL